MAPLFEMTELSPVEKKESFPEMNANETNM